MDGVGGAGAPPPPDGGVAAAGEREAVPLDRQPSLQGQVGEVRPPRGGDFEGLFAVSSDPLLWEQHPSKERAERPGFQHWFDDAVASGGALTVIDRRDGRVIGTSRYHDYDEDRRVVEIGWTFLAR